MDIEELREEADRLGYRLVKKYVPAPACSCWLYYPNENHKCKNGNGDA